MRISATIRNTATSGMKTYLESLATKVQSAVDAAAAHVKERSQALVPVDTGELRESCVIITEGAGLDRKAKVTYTAPHALVVHEDLTARHPNGGQAKFLETALRESVSEVVDMTARKLT